ncbi:MAG: c-type cytochrome biogenesis protein CcmI, partial [Bradyrhizobiaceae bacterium]|nr:c-type cytochrome biogenesis protein CcmI [Bradyrhizobiaceae bacterium]
MTLWLILTIMISVAAVLLSAPFVRRFGRPQSDVAGDIEVYRDQLREIENELRLGLIDNAQAEAARIEIKRRALAADQMAQSAMPKLSQTERSFAMICVVAIVVFGSVALYAITGKADLPSVQGFTTGPRNAFAGVQESSSPEVANAAKFGSESTRQPQQQAGLPSVEEMIDRLVARLAQNPKDIAGWRTLGWSYANTGRFSEAGEAYAKAIELNPDSAEIRSARIEALVTAADGKVTTAAKKAIGDTLKLDPKDTRARFFEGLAKEQEGDRASALTEWVELLKDADPNQPWVSDLRDRVARLERDLGVDPAAHPAGSKSVSASGLLEKFKGQGGTLRAIDKGPSPEDVQRAEAMLPAERSAMIRGMVDGLATRLEQSPRDADGWIKLIR